MRKNVLPIVKVLLKSLTTSNFLELNALVKKYSRKNGCSLNVIAFPSNQFNHQSPGSSDEFIKTLRYVRPGNEYVPDMDLFQRVNVNGVNQTSLFSWLKSCCEAPSEVIVNSNYALWNPIRSSDIYWNFEKFLINSKGFPIKRYSASSNPLAFEKDIDEQIKSCIRARTSRANMNYFSSFILFVTFFIFSCLF
ncbi:glutathione peroxidase 1 isoform X2 [Hydra vulgaris]|uniref:Glutathione peroxidase n=1 Tax=Hydra vulgaris TaxID=6087 RepID=A0ABM4B9D6_HYDVU